MRGHGLAALGILYALVIVALIAAKLAGHLHFAWWIILIPLWIPVAACFVVIILGILFFAAASSSGGNPFQ